MELKKYIVKEWLDLRQERRDLNRQEGQDYANEFKKAASEPEEKTKKLDELKQENNTEKMFYVARQLGNNEVERAAVREVIGESVDEVTNVAVLQQAEMNDLF